MSFSRFLLKCYQNHHNFLCCLVSSHWEYFTAGFIGPFLPFDGTQIHSQNSKKCLYSRHKSQILLSLLPGAWSYFSINYYKIAIITYENILEFRENNKKT